MSYRALGTLGPAFVASLVVSLGACGSSDGLVEIGDPDYAGCTGAACWSCESVSIKNGTRTVCEKTMTGEVPDRYDCGADGPLDTCPPDSTATADAGVGGASSSADDAATPSDAGPAPDAGGYQCEKKDGKVRCEATPTCAPGAHPTPCDECVPDTCSACSCPNAPGDDDHDHDDGDDDAGKGKGHGKDKGGKGKGKGGKDK